MFNKDKFRGKVYEAGKTMNDVAEVLGINAATLNRKTNGQSDFTRNEIELLWRAFGWSMQDIRDIFFCEVVA